MKKAISLLLTGAIAVAAVFIPAGAVQTAFIEYVFTGADSARAGYAEGTVTLNAADGRYLLYWADGDGILDGYYEIAPVDVSGGSGSYTFAERVAIPAGATSLIAVPEGAPAELDSAAAVFTIPAYKRLPYSQSDRLYRSEVLSDIHIDCQDGGSNTYYINASGNFARALDYADQRGADFIVTAGDDITNASGATLEWLEYQRILAASNYDGPVYEALGNHEMRYADYTDCSVHCGIEEFMIATGLDGTAATMAARKPYFDVTEPVSGDHFIFMALETHHDPSKHDEFSDAQISWLENKLSAYSGDGHRIFLIQHALIKGYGAGDDHDDPAYGGALTATQEYPNNLRFKELIEQYRDVIWLSGHTHVDFRDDVNFSDENGTSCLMFHIPSVAGTTRLTYDSEGKRDLDRTFYEDATQGYLLDAYSDAVLLCGVNFYDKKIYPAYTYIVGDTEEGEEPTEVIQTEEPTQPTEPPTEPQPAILYGDADCDGDVTIVDVTMIQRHLASIGTLSEEGMRAAMVDGYDEVNIVDATLIQRWLAGIIDVFPVEEGLASTGASGTAAQVKAQLDDCFQYASYPEYAALKRAYHSGSEAQMQTALNSFIALKARVKPTTVYFSDAKGMGHPNAYAWSSKSGSYIDAWPGQKATYAQKNSYGETIYAVTVDAAKYDCLIFSSGDNKTADIRIAPQSGRVYYPVSDTSPYTVSFAVLRQMWRCAENETATVYFTDTEGWGTPYLYYWNSSGNNTWPGKKMEFVRYSSSGKGIYQATIPADAKVIFSNGSGKKTVDIPAVADGFGYYPYAKDDEGKWSVVEYKY